MMMFDEGEYYSPSEVFSCINSLPNSRKTKMMNKRRFTDEQVKSLESIFENETKLDPKKKVQVARELGLQPRQVAIWFQNKRARYKSKQLEKDYTTLRSNYNALAKLFEDLKKEKQSLVIQLEKLRDLAKDEGDYENKYSNTSEATNSIESQEDEKSESENNNNNTSINSDNNDHKSKTKPALSLEGSEFGGCSSILSEEESSENTKFFGIEDQSELLKMVQPIDSSLTSGEECWDDLQSDGLFDHAVDSCQWWDFWS